MLVDWLEHSDRYSWIPVEADEAKYLDDIVVMPADGRVEVKQVKLIPWVRTIRLLGKSCSPNLKANREIELNRCCRSGPRHYVN